VIGEACFSKSSDFQWLVVDVATTVRSLTVQASSVDYDSVNCSAPSVSVAATLQVSGALVVGVTGPGFLFFESPISVESATVVVGGSANIVGSGSLVARSMVQIRGTLWPGSSGVRFCCRAKFWPGLWNTTLPPTGELVLSAPEILLDSAIITITNRDQFLRLDGHVNSTLCSLLVLSDAAAQQIVRWTSITSTSVFVVGYASLDGLSLACGCVPGPSSNLPFPACAASSGGGIGVLIDPAGCQCSGCPTGTHCTEGSVCACDNGLDSPLCVAALSTTSGTDGAATPSSAPSAGLSGGAVAGIVVGSVVLAGAVVGALVGAKMHAAKNAATMATLRMNPVHQ
jgi:hypothetical protein